MDAGESLSRRKNIGMDNEKFRELVSRAIDELPPRFRRQMENVEVIVEDLPPPEYGRRTRGALLGLYQGVPKTQRSAFLAPPPDLIFLYKKNIERVCRSDHELQEQIRATLLHEVGHHFGMSEEDLEDV